MCHSFHWDEPLPIFLLAVGGPGDNGLGAARLFRHRLCVPDRLRVLRAGVVQGALSVFLAPLQERGHHRLRLHGRRHRCRKVRYAVQAWNAASFKGGRYANRALLFGATSKFRCSAQGI